MKWVEPAVNWYRREHAAINKRLAEARNQKENFRLCCVHFPCPTDQECDWSTYKEIIRKKKKKKK